jgi:hypothetical protein
MIGNSDQLSAKDFLAALGELSAQLRRDIDAHRRGLDASPKAVAARRRRVLQGDFRFFAYTYFPHHIRGEPSLFQAHFCELYPKLLRSPSGSRDWWKAPRGEAKSSLLTKIGPCWIAVQALLELPAVRGEIGWKGAAPPFNDYVVLLGAETRLPAKLLEVVKVELQYNAALALDFPEACGATDVWKIGEFVTKAGVKFESFGAEQAIRGTFHGASRPKVLLGDDLITDAEAKSPTERDKRWDWLEKAIDYLGPPDGSVKFLGVGTELAKGDPINRAEHTLGHMVHAFKAIERFPANMELWAKCEELMRNDDRTASEAFKSRGEVCPEEKLPSFVFYRANRKEMDAAAVTSWPSVRSLYWLMRQRAKNRRAFQTEMQGSARNDEDKTFHRLSFWVHRGSYWIEFAGVDPSMGRGETGHPSALVGGAWDTDKKKLHVHTAEIKRRVPSKLEADLTAYQRAHKCVAIGFENNNAYEALRLSIVKGGLHATPPVAIPLVGITASLPAEVLIDSMEPFVCDELEPRILFCAGLSQLEDELDTWPEKQSHHHYDGLIALYILWAVASTRGAGAFDFSSIPRGRDTRAIDDFRGALNG